MVEQFKLWCAPAKEERTVNVYLPDSYHDTDERYPVVYMFDGHNIFYDEEAAYGKSWGIREFLDHWDKPLIVVGVYCSMHGDERMWEYCPYAYRERHLGFVKGRGKKTMDWFTGDLKNHIDTHYRTLPLRETTAIAGSSMGGIMAYYAAIRYNRFYSKAAVISPAFELCRRQTKEELIRRKRFFRDTRIFFSWGEREDPRQRLEKLIWQLDSMFQEKNVQTYIYKHLGGDHSEGSWEQEVPLWMDYLWKS